MEPPELERPPLSSKEKLIRRYKPVWRVLLIFNLGLGGYMFAKARQRNLDRKAAKQAAEDAKAAAEVPPTTSPALPVYEEPLFASAVIEPVRVHEPIPEEEQRELFKWILEEKRKVKPTNREEKKQIDEEKAILKQFIRSESIPPL